MDFLPFRIRSLTNLVTSRSWNFGSGRIFRLATTRRRGISSLTPHSPRLEESLVQGLQERLLGTSEDTPQGVGPASDTSSGTAKVFRANDARENRTSWGAWR